MGHKSGERVGSSYCHGLGGNQVFAYTKRHQVMSDDNCLDAANSRGPVNLVRCHGMMGNQEWKYDSEVSGWFDGVESSVSYMTPLKIIPGQDDKARQFGKLFDKTNKRRPEYTVTKTMWLLGGTTMADAVTIQMAG